MMDEEDFSINTIDRFQYFFAWAGYYLNSGSRALFHEIESKTRFSIPNSSSLIYKAIEKTSFLFKCMLAWSCSAIFFIPSFVSYSLGMIGRRCFEKIDPQKPSPFEQKPTIRVLSLNTALQTFSPLTAGVKAPFERVDPYSTRVEALAQKILQIDPDIFLGQEVDNFRAREYLGKKLAEQGYYILSDTGADTLGNPSGLFIASKQPIVNAKFQPFASEDKSPDFGNQWCRKGVLSFQFLLKSEEGESKPISVINFHLDSGETEENQKARIHQLVNYIFPLLSNLNQIGIAFGDLNLDTATLSHPEITPIKNFLENKVTCSDEGKHLFRKLRSPKGSPCTECAEKIDGILIHQSHLGKISISDPDLTPWEELSDHFAISTQISFRK